MKCIHGFVSYKLLVRLDYKLIHLSRTQLYTLHRLVLAVSVCFFLVLRYSLLGEAADGEMHSQVRSYKLLVRLDHNCC